jgi:hypothetical protein
MHNRKWRSHDEYPLTAETLRWLFNNEIPCIRVKNYATPEECKAFVAAMDAVGLDKEYQVAMNVKSRPKYIGVPQFEYRKKTKEDYFATVEEAIRKREAVFAHCGFNPLERLMKLINGVMPAHTVQVAQEPGFGSYYAGIIRETTGGTNLHFDFAQFSARDYSVAKNDAQIATNFYASGTTQGGETTVYNLHFDPPVDPGEYYEISPFDPNRVANVESYSFKPTPGDLVMFNSRCPHQVAFNPLDDGQRRMGIGSFIGRAPENKLVLWS